MWTDEGRRKSAAITNKIIVSRSAARQARARELAAEGKNPKQIARIMKLNLRTINGYLQKNR